MKAWHKHAVIIGLLVIIVVAALLSPLLFAPNQSKHAATSSRDLGLILRFGEDRLTVIAVEENSLAEQAGFLPGDCLTFAEGKMLNRVSVLDSIIQANAGKDLTISCLREATEFSVTIRCGEAT